MTLVTNQPTATTPRSFDIDPEGRYLIAAGEGSGKLAVYEIDGDTGWLAPKHSYDAGSRLWWVMAVPR